MPKINTKTVSQILSDALVGRRVRIGNINYETGEGSLTLLGAGGPIEVMTIDSVLILKAGRMGISIWGTLDSGKGINTRFDLASGEMQLVED
jgi:hypothetical protein